MKCSQIYKSKIDSGHALLLSELHLLIGMCQQVTCNLFDMVMSAGSNGEFAGPITGVEDSKAYNGGDLIRNYCSTIIGSAGTRRMWRIKRASEDC